MVGSFYTFFVEVSRYLLNSWMVGSQQISALLGAGGRCRSAPAVVGPRWCDHSEQAATAVSGS